MLLFFSLSSSCTDQGCIEADDFGEYQQQTLTVPSNTTEDSCKYDSSKDLYDASQGSGLKTCFTSGNPSITVDGVTQAVVSSGGCAGSRSSSAITPLDSSFLTSCISNCVSSCLAGTGGSTSINPEPGWTSTDEKNDSQNVGVIILPGSKITITAIGTVNLSNNVTFPEVFIPAGFTPNTDTRQNFKDKGWLNDFTLDVKSGQSVSASFSGGFVRPNCTNGGTLTGSTCSTGSLIPNYSIANVGGLSASASTGSWNSAIHNGARALVAYTIPHPAGYSFDSSQASEILGTKGTPLLPNPLTWECIYNAAQNGVTYKALGTADTTTYMGSLEANCHMRTNGYSQLGYNPSVDTAVTTNNPFPITTAGKSSALGTYGGFIRWAGDNLKAFDFPAFGYGTASYLDTSVTPIEIAPGTTSTLLAGGIPAVPGFTPSILPSGGYTIINRDGIDYGGTEDVTYMPQFRSNAAACVNDAAPTNNFIVSIKDSSGNLIKTNVPIPIRLGWNTYPQQVRLSLKPGQQMIINDDCANEADVAALIKFEKYHDIQINQSGFVSFTTLNASSGTCVLNGRIINPAGSTTNFLDGTATVHNSDYYEYDDFDVSPSNDPFEALEVPPSFNDNTVAVPQVWSNKVFVRKGQIIRLSPISWMGTFVTSHDGVSRECGIGMAMRIEPRPALLCKGARSEPVANPDTRCTPDVDTSSTLLGCKATASECDDSTSSAYCPYAECRDTIKCTAGTSTNHYTKTSCSRSTYTSACDTLLTSYGITGSLATSTKAKCSSTPAASETSSCSGKMMYNAQRSATVDASVDQCYDLENYTGSVQNIPTDGFTTTQLADPLFAKGAVKLGLFNGTYGNFDSYSDSGTTDDSTNHNKIYRVTTPITFAKESRLKFLLLNNDFSFRDLPTKYTNASSAAGSFGISYTDLTNAKGTSYTGTNGFRVSFTGGLQVTNGQWLEARLCRSKSDNSCTATSTTTPLLASGTPPTSLSSQPLLVLIDDPVVVTDPVISRSSNYKFDSYGTLTRTTTGGTAVGDCSAANQGVDTAIGSPYYCHTYLDDTHTYTYNPNSSVPFTEANYASLKALRLTFKIKDPEVSNCYIPTSSHKSSSSTAVTAGDTLTSPANNGIIMLNSAYVAGGANTGATCTYSDGTPSISATTPCTKQYYCASKYSNNSGSYSVTVKVENPASSSISNIIGGVITPVVQVMDGVRTTSGGITTTTMGQVQRVYTMLVLDTRFQAILSMSLVVMITFYGMTYLMGISEMNSTELMNRGIKIALIYLFASPSGWYWFNKLVVNFFKGGTDYLAFTMASSFDSSTDVAQALAKGDYYDKSVLFGSVDKVFSMFFSQAVQKKISALLFASLFGWAYLWIIYLSFMLYVYAVGNAVLYYLTAQVFISILFTLGPIFFIFTLFTPTKGFFDNWLNQIIGFSLQQIFLLATLAFFNMMMYEVIKMSLGYKICWDEVWSIDIITRISLLSFWTIASLPPKASLQGEIGSVGGASDIPSLFSILFIWVIARLMNDFITFMNDLGASIGGSLSASSMASGIKTAVEGAQKFASKKAGDLQKKTIGDPLDRMDKAMFDSGKTADKERAQRQEQNKNDQRLKADLTKAGDKAMSKFKVENGAAFANMSDEKKKEALNDAKNKGMSDRATKLGVSKDKLEEIKNDKGLKYEGSNALVAGMQAIRQASGHGGGTLTKSMSEAKANTGMSFKEQSASKKSMSGDERKSFDQAAKDGKVAVGTSRSQKIIGAAKAVYNARQTVKSAGGALKAAGGKLMRKTENATGGDEWKAAVKQLEKSGEINRMDPKFGERFANAMRPAEEKEKIQKQMDKNREERGVKSPIVNDATTLAKMDKETKNLDKDAESAKSRPMVTAAASAIFGAGGASNVASAATGALSSVSKAASAVKDRVSSAATGVASGTADVAKKLEEGNYSGAAATMARGAAGALAAPTLITAEIIGATAGAAYGAAKSMTKEHEGTQKHADDNNSRVASTIKDELAATQKELGSKSSVDPVTGAKVPGTGFVGREEAANTAVNEIKEMNKLMTDGKIEPGSKEEDQLIAKMAAGGSEYFKDMQDMRSLRDKHADKDTTAVEKLAIDKQMEAITSKSSYIESAGKAGGLQNALGALAQAQQSQTNLGIREKALKRADSAMTASANIKSTIDKVAAPREEAYKKESTLLKAVDKMTFGFVPTTAAIKDHREAKSAQKEYNALAKEGIGSKATEKHEAFAKKYEGMKDDSKATPPPKPGSTT